MIWIISRLYQTLTYRCNYSQRLPNEQQYVLAGRDPLSIRQDIDHTWLTSRRAFNAFLIDDNYSGSCGEVVQNVNGRATSWWLNQPMPRCEVTLGMASFIRVNKTNPVVGSWQEVCDFFGSGRTILDVENSCLARGFSFDYFLGRSSIFHWVVETTWTLDIAGAWTYLSICTTLPT